MRRPIWILALLLLVPGLALAQSEGGTRLLRYPDICGNTIAFVYGGDIWLVDAEGGVARRLTSGEGDELLPKFSPDCKSIAFTGQYTGTRQVYVIPVDGGSPRQLTFHNDVGEHPAPRRLRQPGPGLDPGRQAGPLQRPPHPLQRAQRAALPDPGGRRHGGPAAHPRGVGRRALARRRPLRLRADHATSSAPGSATAAAAPPTSGSTTSRRTPPSRSPTTRPTTTCRCGSATRSTSSPTATRSGAPLNNLFAYDTKTKAVRRVTNHGDFDVFWPSSGDRKRIVYEDGG